MPRPALDVAQKTRTGVHTKIILGFAALSVAAAAAAIGVSVWKQSPQQQVSVPPVKECEATTPTKIQDLCKNDPFNKIAFIDQSGTTCYSLSEIVVSSNLKEDLFDPEITKVYPTAGLDTDTKEFAQGLEFWKEVEETFGMKTVYSELAEHINSETGILDGSQIPESMEGPRPALNGCVAGAVLKIDDNQGNAECLGVAGVKDYEGAGLVEKMTNPSYSKEVRFGAVYIGEQDTQSPSGNAKVTIEENEEPVEVSVFGWAGWLWGKLTNGGGKKPCSCDCRGPNNCVCSGNTGSCQCQGCCTCSGT